MSLLDSDIHKLLRDMPRDHVPACCKGIEYCNEEISRDQQQLDYASAKLKTVRKVCHYCFTLKHGDTCDRACEFCGSCQQTPHTWHCPLFISAEDNQCGDSVWREHTHCKDCGYVVYKDAGPSRKACSCYCLWCGGTECSSYCHITGLYRGNNRRYRLLRSTSPAIKHLTNRKGEEYVRQVLAKEAKRYPPARATKWLRAFGLDRFGNPHPLHGKGGSGVVVSQN